MVWSKTNNSNMAAVSNFTNFMESSFDFVCLFTLILNEIKTKNFTTFLMTYFSSVQEGCLYIITQKFSGHTDKIEAIIAWVGNSLVGQ